MNIMKQLFTYEKVASLSANVSMYYEVTRLYDGKKFPMAIVYLGDGRIDYYNDEGASVEQYKIKVSQEKICPTNV